MHAAPEDVIPESLDTMFGRVWRDIQQWVKGHIAENEGSTVFFIDDLEILSVVSSSEKDCIEYLSNLRSTMLSRVFPL